MMSDNQKPMTPMTMTPMTANTDDDDTDDSDLICFAIMIKQQCPYTTY